MDVNLGIDTTDRSLEAVTLATKYIMQKLHKMNSKIETPSLDRISDYNNISENIIFSTMNQELILGGTNEN